MGEGTGFAGRITEVMAAEYRDVARKVWSMTRGRIIAYSETEVNVLVTNLKNATNAWLVLGSTTLTAGPSPVSAALVTGVQNVYDGWVRKLALEVWARVTADKDYQDQSEIEELVVSLKAGINVWMQATPNTTDASEEAPYAPNKIGSAT